MSEISFSGTRFAINVLVVGLAITPLVYMAVQYPGLPERIPIHWNARAQVDAWAEKSVLTVFLPSILTVVVQTLLWLFSVDLLDGIALVAGTDLASVYKRDSLQASFILMQALRVILAFMLFLISFALPASNTLGGAPQWMSLGIFVCTSALVIVALGGAWRLYRLQNKWQAEAPASLPEFRAENWRWGGAFYYNPSDPAFLVHKRIGTGFTINVAHSRARIYGLLFAVILALVVASVVSTARAR